ncbi:MAG: hypothetical protein KF832_01530 [Caldilineaceae bacterium]|nr:hypothetical protein [Caldilineaceae bacterium]
MALISLLISPIGPSLLLMLGAITALVIGRWLRRPAWLAGVALSFTALAGWLLLFLRSQPAVIPTFSLPWRPILQVGTNLYWLSDGWNWYIAGLVLLLGSLGILLDLNSDYVQQGRRIHNSLAVQLAVLAAALLFVSSGNLLTAILTWVLLDVCILLRSTTRPLVLADATAAPPSHHRGLSLIGAMLLLIALLPAGPTGPGQEFQNGTLPVESVLLLALAALIRAGVYPFHIWLLPERDGPISVAERLLEHMVPTLCGLWLLGWTYGLGRDYILLRLDVLAVFLLMLLGSAIAAWSATEENDHHSFVLIASAGLAALTGALTYNEGPSAMIWPTTAFALGGGLWLVGERVWRGWGWAIPVSIGALTLAGMPLTPGFLAQPSLARLWAPGTVVQLLFLIYVIAQSFQIAALLRSWEDVKRAEPVELQPGARGRLLLASVALGLPLAITGFLPRTVAAIASMPNAIPPTLGDPPSVVARQGAIWLTVAAPMLLGYGLVWLRPKIWHRIGASANRLQAFIQLNWLFDYGWLVLQYTSELWGNVTRVVEGAGYMGWVLVFALIGYLLTH